MSAFTIDNEAIVASAGSGKTYQLAMRYMKLLAGGCMPDQICAMTFSRKAAGEIFDAVVANLCRAAESDAAAKETCQSMGAQGLGRGDFLRLLRVLLDNLQHSRISTLDSFTVSIIRAFPMELGISTELELMDNDGSAARLTRHQILARVFNHRLVGPEIQKKFHEAFKAATFGKEESDMVEPLDTFIKENWKRYRAIPDVEAWGNAERIWPGGCSLLAGKRSPSEAGEQLREIIAHRDFPQARIADGLLKLVDALRCYDATTQWSEAPTNHSALKALLQIPDLSERDSALISYYKEFSLGRKECGLWSELINNFLGVEIKRKLQETSGIGRILEQYNEQYEPMMRGGKMTFEDAQYLLTSANVLNEGERLSRDPQNRLYIDYRLNCRLDHWLLDEFQDTSDLQWEVVDNLIDEVMTDDSGSKSFFFVGDVKQAIHGWRGGNARLFGEVLMKYGGRIKERPLHVSFRSCEPVIDMVNHVFGRLPDTVSCPVRERWNELWQEHECAEDHVPEDGYAGLLQAVPTGEKGECLDEDRYRVVGELIRELDPVSRGLSVVVLVRDNASGQELVDQLRRECPGLLVCHEGRAAICDNPVVAVLLSLVKLAAHPGDTLAWRHLQMSPLGVYIEKENLAPAALSYMLLGQIQEDGFESLIRDWGNRLGLRKDDSFGRKRVDDLAAAASIFDAGDSRECSEFLHFVSGHETEEAGTKTSVNVMTIHKAKGIGRDVVIIPSLEGKLRRSVDFALKTAPEEWALKLPPKIVVEADDTLRRVRDEMLEDSEFEEICVLYVALTRAKRASYVVVGHDSPESSSASLLKSVLAGEKEYEPMKLGDESVECLHEAGNRKWYLSKKSVTAEKKSEKPVLSKKFRKQKSIRPSLVRREPSKHRGQVRSATRLFDREDTDVIDFGSAIHELFEEVAWIEDADVDAIISEWEPASGYEEVITRDVVRQFRACLESDVVRQALARPEGDAELWHEKRFEVVLKGELVAGAFDRVVITRDDEGNPVSAVVMDYKSSVVETEEDISRRVEDYTPQMEAYRAALAAILNLAANKIELQLLFTRRAVIRTL